MHPRSKPSRELARAVGWSLVCCAAVASCFLALFHAFDQPAEANETLADERTEDESPDLDQPLPFEAARQAGLRPMRQRDPFAPYPADPGGLSFEELSPELRAAVDASQEWAEADSGNEVHQAFKRATAVGVVRARARSAERDVGLVGAASLGVD